ADAVRARRGGRHPGPRIAARQRPALQGLRSQDSAYGLERGAAAAAPRAVGGSCRPQPVLLRAQRSEERRVGKECRLLCRSRWSAQREKKKSGHSCSSSCFGSDIFKKKDKIFE